MADLIPVEPGPCCVDIFGREFVSAFVPAHGDIGTTTIEHGPKLRGFVNTNRWIVQTRTNKIPRGWKNRE